MKPSFVRLTAAKLPRRAQNAQLNKAKANRGALEKPTQRTILQWLRAVLPPGSMVSATMNEAGAASKDPAKRARFYEARKASGVVTGWPDLTIALHAGRTVYLETKRPKGGVLSVAQQDVHADLRRLGHFVAVATSIESARYELQQAGVVLREAPGQLAAPAVYRFERRPDSIDAAGVPF